MTDPTEMRQPTEEELRAYLSQLRAADAAGILAQVYEMLGTAAEVKLGRPDARMLIDTMAAVVDAAADGLPADLAERMRAGIAQLQMAQVQAEQEPGAEGPAEPEPETSEPPGASQRMTDRLWIPGRGESPPPAR